ncbi:MAG: hypothetical protein WCF18_22660 [Chthoniobacteraceae bacterium]
MDPKRLALLAAAALLAVALWLAWLWQPERQVRLHTASLLKGIERRNWSNVQDLLADNYADRWGHDKNFVVTGLRQVFGSFVFLKIEHENVSVDAVAGRTRTRVKMSGQGSAVAQYVMAKVNSLAEPFTFTWEKRSGKPWDWQLTAVDHPTLEPDSELQF